MLIPSRTRATVFISITYSKLPMPRKIHESIPGDEVRHFCPDNGFGWLETTGKEPADGSSQELKVDRKNRGRRGDVGRQDK
jgi:hypothetical protein